MQEIKNFLTPDECQELITMIDANHSRSSVVVGGTDRSDVTDHRTSSTSNLDMQHGFNVEYKNKNSQSFKFRCKKRRSSCKDSCMNQGNTLNHIMIFLVGLLTICTVKHLATEHTR